MDESDNATCKRLEGERAVLNKWIDGFPDRDNKFAKEFQTTFNFSFWEIYLYELFRTYGYDMDWTYASPDFLVTTPYGAIVVEAATANAAMGKVTEWERKKPIGDRQYPCSRLLGLE